MDSIKFIFFHTLQIYEPVASSADLDLSLVQILVAPSVALGCIHWTSLIKLIHLSQVVRKWAFGYMQTAKLQASLCIPAVLPEALLFA